MQKFPTIICFDLETTGFDPVEDRIIEIGILKFTLDKKGELNKLDEYTSLVDPEIELSLESELITGIKQEDLNGKPTIKKLLPELSQKFEGADFVLGHNVDFDLSFMSQYLKLDHKKLDSLFFSQTFFPGLPSYSLDVLPFELDITRDVGHRALPDAIVSAEVFAKALRQFAALKMKDKVLALARKGNLVEAEILGAAADFLVPEKLFKKPESLKSQPAIIPEIKDAVADKFKNKKKSLVLHSVRSGGPASAMDALNLKRGKVLVSVKHTNDLRDGLAQLNTVNRLVCAERLDGLLKKSPLKKSEATMAMKLTISGDAKLSSEEKNFLPEVLVFPEICKNHQCPNFKKLEVLNQKDFAVGVSHYDLWSLEELPKGTKLLLTDFDEAVDTLMKKLEIKLSADFLPSLLAAISTEDEGIKNLVSEVTDRNDLFWGVLNINFKDVEQSPMLLTDELRDGHEFVKLTLSAKSLVGALSKLISKLQAAEDDYLRAFGFHLNKTLSAWQSLEDLENYHIYLEKNFEQASLKLCASFKLIQEEFKSHIPETATLTAATGADSVSLHYINMLGIGEWPVTQINLPFLKHSSLFVISNNTPTIDKAIKIILTEAPAKSVIVAKNAREIALFHEHLKNSLPLKVIAADQSGASKALYNFAREERAVLIISPRGRILDLPWPQIDLCIVSSIPFPMPEPHFSFMSSSFPKAMLAQKLLISKILRSGGPELKIYLADGRLTSQKYGENFIALTSELCGCEPEYLRS